MNIIFLIKCVVLGIVQGLTEPLPISSSGHVVIIGNLIGAKDLVDEIDFSILLNFGSLIAILIIFRKEIIDLIVGTFKYIFKKDKTCVNSFKYVMMMIIATIPAGLIGLLLKDFIDEVLGNYPKIIGISLLVTAFFLFLIKDFKGKKKSKDITVIDSIVVGLCQAVALLPGISRSGATITGGLFRKLDRETAFKFSFMLYIPISLATLVLDIKDFNFSNTAVLIPYIIATIIAGILTYVATKLFKNMVIKGKLMYFVIYCILVGTVVILFI